MRNVMMPCLALALSACVGDLVDLREQTIPLSARSSVPPEIAVASDQHIVLDAHGVGFQIYECAVSDGGKRRWAFHAPAALLLDEEASVVASHFGGIDAGLPPGAYWMSTRDGSRVHGGKAVSAPNPGAIPLLRLEALDVAGDGIFTPVTFIHRLDTSGGVAPSGSCPRIGELLPVFYEARYVFYAAGLRGAETAAELAAPEDHNLAHVFHAEGVQVYECTAGATGELAFAFRAPRASLFDETGELEVDHFGGIEVGLPAGAYWQSVKDDSRVRAGNAIPAPNPGAIPLLRLETLDTAGTGILSRVSFVQRLATVGGVAPAGPCAPAGERVAVPYSADYFFYIPTLAAQ
jgi:hypothetical protein